MRFFVIIIAVFLSFTALFSQDAVIVGKVLDSDNNPIEFANVTVVGKAVGTSTGSDGKYELKVAAGEEITIGISSIGFAQYTQTIALSPGERKILDFTLEQEAKELGQVVVEDKQVRSTTLSRLDPKVISIVPDASGNFESIIKTFAGVSSSNELSSQYSVRGGSFDENLVYVNDIEIYRPLLVRSGQQEGLSFVNSDMVSSVLFSAGGFDSNYGDKMSSVLDIKYRKPQEFGAVATASLMGASLMFEGASKSKKFTHISGVRYKTTEYILNSMETEGDYSPKFLDMQTYMTYKVSPKLEVGVLGNIAQNRYEFVPTDRRTKFGSYGEAMELRMFFEGKEMASFNTYMGAVSFDYKHNEALDLKLITSTFYTDEQETFDIQSEYWINEISFDPSTGETKDSVLNVGVGSYLEHARNYLQAKVYSVAHKGSYVDGASKWMWGVKMQREEIEDDLSEWKYVDSAGYSVPVSNSEVRLQYVIKGKNSLASHRYSAYLQHNYLYNLSKSELWFTAGVRGSYWDFTNEFIVSPRATVSLAPYWDRDFLFRFSTGLYYQPAFYKEMRMFRPVGNTGVQQIVINDDIKSQKSIHFVLGSDYNFMAWGRPFKLVSELYYKILQDLVPYSVDNVRTIYQGYNNSDGYATGLDMKLNGEFVPGVESWFSLSVMQTRENLRDDSELVDDGNGNLVLVDPGMTPRPTDQRVNVGLFFQDYLPMNPKFKMHLQMNFGTGLPFSYPLEPSYNDDNRMKAYQRVDLGFSRILKSRDKEHPKGHFLHHIEESWITLDIFNMFDKRNTMSYEWVSDYEGKLYAVENSLTGRRVNLKLMIKL